MNRGSVVCIQFCSIVNIHTKQVYLLTASHILSHNSCTVLKCNHWNPAELVISGRLLLFQLQIECTVSPHTLKFGLQS